MILFNGRCVKLTKALYQNHVQLRVIQGMHYFENENFWDNYGMDNYYYAEVLMLHFNWNNYQPHKRQC